MKCVLVVHSGKERIKRSCELPDEVNTKKKLRKFLQSQDLRLDSMEFTFTVHLVKATSKSGEDDAEEAVLHKDADVVSFLQKAEKKKETHVLTFEVIIPRKDFSPNDLDCFLSAEYTVDNDLVSLHIFSPSASPSCEEQTKYQEKMFIIPKRFVLANLVRAVEDTLSMSPTKHGMKLVLYTLPQQRGGARVEISDDATALQLLRHHASKRTGLRLTHATRVLTPKPPSQGVSRRGSQQPVTSARVASPPSPAAQVPPHPLNGAGAKSPKPHPPPLSTLVGDPSSPSSGKPSQSSQLQRGAASSSGRTQEIGTPPSSAQAAAPSSTDAPDTPYRVFLRQPTTPLTKYEVPVQVGTLSSEGASASVGSSSMRGFSFVYTKKEVQLWRRFAAECELTAGVATAVHVPVLSSDPSVCLETDDTLREWLALAKESQQPLRVLLALRCPVPPASVKADVPAASTPTSPIVVTGQVLAQSDVAPAASVDLSSASVGDTRCKPGEPSPGESGDTESLPDPRANTTLSPLAPLYGDGTDRTRSTQRSLSSLQRSSLSSLKGVSSSLAPLVESPTTVCSEVLSTRQEILSAKGPSSSAGSEHVHDTVLQVSSSDLTERRTPPLVARTAEGPSIAVATAVRLSCVCEANDGDTPSIRVQICVRWGDDQRMVLCRVRESTALEDFRRATLDAFLNGATVSDEATPTSMELVYFAKGRQHRAPFETGLSLFDLRAKLLVDSAVVNITAPATPPFPQCERQVGEESFHAAQASATLLHMLADAIEKHSSLRVLTTNVEISNYLRAELGEIGSAEPFRQFLDVAVATPLKDPMTDPDDDTSLSQRLLPWVSSVLAGMKAPSSTVIEVLVEVTSTLLRSRLCDIDFLLDQLAMSARVVGEGSVGTDKAVPRTTVPPSFAALWKAAGLDIPQGTSTAVWNPFRATCAEHASGWRVAYAATPAAVLDLLATGNMDGLWVFARPCNPQVDMVWQRSLLKAHRECCEAIGPNNLERYFKSGDSPNGGVAREHRRVILSCVGALLAPSSATICDYAEWISQRFRGKVATVLYANMLDYDDMSHVSAFTLTQVAWTLLHPQLGGRSTSTAATSASLTILDRLREWALLATQRLCQRRHMSFPPSPLLHVHTASPVPFVGSGVPLSANGVAAEEQASKELSLPPWNDAATETTCSQQGCFPSSEDDTPHSNANVPASRKVRYAFKYNFDSLRNRLKRK